MSNPAAILAPLALLLGSAGEEAGDVRLVPLEQQPQPVSAPSGQGWLALDAVRRIPVVQQVRIEQRVIIRVAPRSSATRQNMVAEMAAPPPLSMRLAERKMEKCLPVRGIAAVQPGQGGQLLLFLRDQRLVSASLEKACLARDYYSGFYLERSDDGMLCVDRDKLQSRTGAKCSIGRMRELVATED